MIKTTFKRTKLTVFRRKNQILSMNFKKNQKYRFYFTDHLKTANYLTKGF
jgi:hypothetical protein